MKTRVYVIAMASIVGVGMLLLSVDLASGGRGRGGGGRGGGGARGGGVSRPAGGGVSRPSGGAIGGGAGVSRPSTPNINRSPGVSNPISRPSVQPKVGGGGLGARDRPGVVSPPNLTPGNRPGIGAGQGGLKLDGGNVR